jgi:hypothetical protein
MDQLLGADCGTMIHQWGPVDPPRRGIMALTRTLSGEGPG